MDDEGNKLIAVDWEWHGPTYIDGDLRTIQLAWKESDALVIEFHNEQNEWNFALDGEGDTNTYNYHEVGQIVGSFLREGSLPAAQTAWLKCAGCRRGRSGDRLVFPLGVAPPQPAAVMSPGDTKVPCREAADPSRHRPPSL